MARPAGGRNGGRAAGGIHGPDDYWTRGAQSKLSAPVSLPVSGVALVGVEGKDMVADRAGGGVRRTTAIYVSCGAFHTFSPYIIWLELSASLGQEKGPLAG